MVFIAKDKSVTVAAILSTDALTRPPLLSNDEYRWYAYLMSATSPIHQVLLSVIGTHHPPLFQAYLSLLCILYYGFGVRMSGVQKIILYSMI